jgi:NitT/TauT family transport system permease protein
MNFKQNRLLFFSKIGQPRLPNQWDLLGFGIVLGCLGLLVWSGSQMTAPYQLGETLQISLVHSNLPRYASLTVLRMLIALLLSLLFTLIIGSWAAKSKRAARVFIPCIDILQSVPVLGFLSITITGFIRLFPGSRLGPECAAIFAIFTAQAWNMCLSFYQSLTTIPQDLIEATTLFQLSPWQRFWRLEVPFALPGLLWNGMLSMSASWVFLVASESIAVANQTINLPGIGSYLGLAITTGQGEAVIWAMITMLIVILFYNQLLFRPLLDWSRKFTLDDSPNEVMHPRAWMTIILQRAHILQSFYQLFRRCGELLINLRLLRTPAYLSTRQNAWLGYCSVMIGRLLQIALSLLICWTLIHFAFTYIKWQEMQYTLTLGYVTALRVMLVVTLSLIVWLPIGVWVGLRPRLTNRIQPIVQFLAAFPANVLFPLVVSLLVKWQLSIEVGTLFLMLLSTQWYILFNVIAGSKAIPKDLKQMAENLGLGQWIWWKRVILPGVFPYLVTGIMTAVGSAWNLTVVAEVMRWGSTTLSVTGLGAYINQASDRGDFSRVAVGMITMSLFVLLMNYLLWQPLHRLAQSKYRLS